MYNLQTLRLKKNKNIRPSRPLDFLLMSVSSDVLDTVEMTWLLLCFVETAGVGQRLGGIVTDVGKPTKSSLTES